MSSAMISDNTMTCSGADFLCHALASVGVTHVYGGHGGAVVPLIDAIVAHPALTWVVTRCEVNASQMAAAHAKLTGNIACCIATSGPGAAHLLSGLVDADQDRVPVVCITGLKAIGHARYGNFQDIDQSSIFRMAQLALSEQVSSIDQLLPLTRNAFTVANSEGRCVHLGVPIDVQMMEVEAPTYFCLGTTFQTMAACRPTSDMQKEALVMALKSEVDAKRNVLIACGYRANALGLYLEELAELLHSPILTSFDGKGTVDEGHPLAFGVVGVYGNAGTPSAVDVLKECHTVVGICISDWTELICNKAGLQMRRMIQIDDQIVSGDAMRFTPTVVYTCGYLEMSLKAVVAKLKGSLEAHPEHKRRMTTRRTTLMNLKSMGGKPAVFEPKTASNLWEVVKKETFEKPSGTPTTYLDGSCVNNQDIKSTTYCHPGVFFNVMRDHLSASSVMCADTGDNSLFMASALGAMRGQRFLTSEHLGIMGYSINAGIVASLHANSIGEEGRKTLVVAGDGGSQMSINELATYKDHGASNVLVVIIINSRLGRVQNEQWGPGLRADGCHIGRPDYVKLFDSYGYPGGMVLSTCDCEVISNKIEKGWELAALNGCCVIEVHQDPETCPIMHKLKHRESQIQKLRPWSLSNDKSLYPMIKTHDLGGKLDRVNQWLNSLRSAKLSDSYWLNKANFLSESESPSDIVQTLFESYGEPELPPLFGSEESKMRFDQQFQAAFLNAMTATGHIKEVLSKGTSNGYALKLGLLALPPNLSFSLHSHPNMELDMPFVGEFWERRLIGSKVDEHVLASLSPLTPSLDGSNFYEEPLEEEVKEANTSIQAVVDEKLQTLGTSGKFVDRVIKEGQVLYNGVGSIHQSYTKEGGCLILALWSGVHANFTNCACCVGIHGNEMLFMPK